MDSNSEQELRHLQLWEMEEAEADRKKLTKYYCPCKKCMGSKVVSRNTIRKHLREHKRDPQFRKSILVCPPYSCLPFPSGRPNWNVLILNMKKCWYCNGLIFRRLHHEPYVPYLGGLHKVVEKDYVEN
jgi:hypothetical protein